MGEQLIYIFPFFNIPDDKHSSIVRLPRRVSLDEHKDEFDN